jgi:hypothetical protein
MSGGFRSVATQPWMSSTLLKQFVTKKEVVTPDRTAIYRKFALPMDII